LCIGILCKIRYYVDITVVSSLYYALVYPFLIYGIIAWANTYSTTLQSLFILQKKGIRLKTFSIFAEHTNPLFKNWILLSCMIWYHIIFSTTKLSGALGTRLTKEVNQLNHQLKEFRFDIDNFKDQWYFYTGLSDYETMMLCYSMVEESSKNLNYGSYVKQTDDWKIGRWRKLPNFQEFIMVLVKLWLGLFNRDLAYWFKVSETEI